MMLPVVYGEESADYFLLSYSPGSSWNDSISYALQPGLKQHHEYLRELHRQDLIVMGGEIQPSAGEAMLSVMLLRTGSLEAAERIASQDPGVQMRLVQVEILPWRVNMSSMRVMQRRPAEVFDDPDQSFTIKRVDPDSRLNLDD